MRLFFVSLIFIMTLSAQAREFSLKIEANSISSLSPEERKAIHSSLEAVEGLLPTKIKETLAPQVTLQFPLLSSEKSREKSERWVRGILLREIFRLYDDKNHTLSDHPVFLTAAGWTKQGLIVKTRSQSSNNERRNNPEPGDLNDPKEFMAANFELFLLDPEYKCRRPSLSRLFQKFFNHIPFPTEQCTQSHQVLLEPDILIDQIPQTIDLDLSRLYQIDYLLASKGETISSRGGQSLERPDGSLRVSTLFQPFSEGSSRLYEKRTPRINKFAIEFILPAENPICIPTLRAILEL